MVNKAEKRDKWLDEVKAENRLSPRDLDLVKRASDVLIGNIVTDQNCAWGGRRGIVPAPVEYCEGIWNWDAAFHAVAVSRFDPALAYEQFEIFFDFQGKDGIFPDMIFRDGSKLDNYSKPPVFPWAFAEVYKHAANQEKLKVAYEKYTLNERFWRMKRFDEPSGLFHYDATTIDDNPLQHMKWETGMDDSPRWDRGVNQYLTVDLNAYMIMFYDVLLSMANMLSFEDDIGVWEEKRNLLAAAINRRLWCVEKNCYLDRDRFTGEFSSVLSSASFTLLFAGCADADKAGRMAENAKNYDLFYPTMPSVAFNDPTFDSARFWRGPVWYNHAFFAIEGLRRYGFADLANEIRETLLRFADHEKRGIFEYYNSKTGEGCGAKNYGWTAACIIEMIFHKN